MWRNIQKNDLGVIIYSECTFSQKYPSLDFNGQAPHGPLAINQALGSDFQSQPALCAQRQIIVGCENPLGSSESLPNTCLVNQHAPTLGLVLD